MMTAVTTPFSTVARAVARMATPGPVGAATVTVGAEVYPDPPFVISIFLTILYFLSKKIA